MNALSQWNHCIILLTRYGTNLGVQYIWIVYTIILKELNIKLVIIDFLTSHHQLILVSTKSMSPILMKS